MIVLRPAWMEVDLDAIASNCELVRRHVGADKAIIAVVKANAYGHGAAPVARRLVDCGAELLAVALLQEAVELRDAGIDSPILVLGAPDCSEAEGFVEYGVQSPITNAEFARALSEAGTKVGCDAVPCQVKIDSGMGRQGVRADEAAELGRLIRGLGNLDVRGVFSHFACAGSDHEFTCCQTDTSVGAMQAFTEALGKPVPLRHLANSGGVSRCPESWLEGVRPGAILYGITPPDSSEGLPGTRQAMTLKARIVCLKRLLPGETVGYGRTYTAQDSARVAILPIGYADGYPRSLSNNADVLVGGKRCPVVGRVSMDAIVVDVTAVPEARMGDESVLIGAQGEEFISVDELARRADTIVQEIVARMSARLPRVYGG